MEQNGKPTVYRGCSPVVDTTYEQDSTDSLTWTVADALARAAGIEATELPPLYTALDLDLVEQLIDEDNPDADAAVLLCFRLNEWNVFVSSDGRIRVCDGADAVDPEPVFDQPLD